MKNHAGFTRTNFKKNERNLNGFTRTNFKKNEKNLNGFTRTNFKKNEKNLNGFTLIELLVVISIISILASIIAIIINPVEIIKRSRDAGRLSDLANLQMAINMLVQENLGSSTNVLCHPPASPPCSGSSDNPDPNTRKTDGTGWIKVHFDAQGSVTAATLPVDPVNSGGYVYTYATDQAGETWEINAMLESEKEKGRMEHDGGNNPTKYEIGLGLNILP